MEITLYYRGELGSNKGTKQKHNLRKAFHDQLSILWQQYPLSDMQWLWNTENKLYKQHCDVSSEINGIKFVPIISKYLYMVADINIELLRPEPPGTFNTQSGDLDNRVKTLLDALRAPSKPEELPNDAPPPDNEAPFYCLLEDDELIHKFSVTTRRLLEDNVSPREVILVINIKTSLTRAMAYNEHLGGNIV